MKSTPHALPLTVCTLAIGLLSGLALAHQPGEESENSYDAKPDKGFVFEVYTQSTFASDADFDRDIGELSFYQFEAGLKASRQIGDTGQISLGFEGGLIDYDITPSAISVAGDAANIGAEFDDVTTLSLIAIYANQMNSTSAWFVGVGVLANGESDADFGDSIDTLFTAGYKHKVNSDLELGLGVVVRTRLDDDVLIVPLPQIKYTINEFWSIASEGVGAKLSYKASNSLSYGLSGQYQSKTFRLDDSHALASGGMVTHRRVPVAFFAEYSPNDTIEISGRIGGLLAGELEILNTAGNNIATEDLDTGIFGSLSVSFKF